MKRIARIALLVALLIGGGFLLVRNSENPVQHAKELNEKTEAALKKGDYDQGAILAKQAQSYSIEHLGPRHSETLESDNNLVVLYYYQGRYKEAETLCKKTLRLCKEVLGDEHKDTLGTMLNLDELYRITINYQEAEPLFINVLLLQKNSRRRTS